MEEYAQEVSVHLMLVVSSPTQHTLLCEGIIMASTGKPMNYNTGLSVGSTGDLPLPLGESVIIMGHGMK